MFSFAQGIIHEYYAVALAPAIGALVGIGATALWARRAEVGWRLCLAAIVAGTAVWAFVLLDRSPTWLPWLRLVVVVGGLLAAALLVIADRLARRAALTLAGVGVALALTGPAFYSVQTASAAHSGRCPAPDRPWPPAAAVSVAAAAAADCASRAPADRRATRPRPAAPRRAARWAVFRPPAPIPAAAAGAPDRRRSEAPRPRRRATAASARPAAAGPAASAGGLLDASTPSSALVALLRSDADHYTWVAATVGAQSAAGYQLATDDPVMSLGGFNGSDPYPTLAEFEAIVNAGKVHYYIGGGSGGVGDGSSMSAIATWVKAHFTSRTVGGVTIYDLTSPTG